MTHTQTADRSLECPYCKAGPSDVSWSTANHQYVCSDESCPIVSWREDKYYPEGGHG